MPKRKTVEAIEEKNFPRALIIGGGIVASYLSRVLVEHGCSVKLLDAYLQDSDESPLSGKFDYIFQFGNFAAVDQVIKSHTSSSGKILFIETAEENNLIHKERLRIIRIGSLEAWDIGQLVGKLMRVMFSAREEKIVDIRKKLSFPVSVSIPKPVARPKVKQDLTLLATSRPGRRIGRKIIILGLTLTLFLLVLGGGMSYWYISSIKKTLVSFNSHLASSNWQAVASDVSVAKNKLITFRNIYNFFSLVFFPLRATPIFQDLDETLIATSEVLDASSEIFSTFGQLKHGSTSFFSSPAGISKAELLFLGDKMKKLQSAVTGAKRKIEGAHLLFFPRESFVSFLTTVSEKLASANEVLPLVEKLFFAPQTKVYLVLFQNNMELRPTGGFIGSFGLMTVSEGKIVDFKIEDVYTADGQLKGHVDPPAPIRKYLSQPHFFLRDSNFDPDFAVSAAKAAWFLEKELGTSVDGVFGINLFLIQKLLAITGSLKIADFNSEEVTADNFFFKTHFQATQNFFPGSTQKKDFLTAVTNTLLQHLTVADSGIWLELLSTVKQALEEKNIVLYDVDTKVQQVFESLSFAGRMMETKCVESKVNQTKLAHLTGERSCFSDYLSVVEANLGVNKANYFINKSVAVEKKIMEAGQIVSIVTLSYENLAAAEIDPAATYTNYLRLFVPAGSTLTSVTLNNAPLASTLVDIERYGADKTVFGFLVKIAPGNYGIVKVTYTLPHLLTAERSSYQLIFQKQGGDKISPLVLSVTYPPQVSWQPLNFTSTSGRQNEIFYTTDTSIDRIFALARG